MKMAPSDPDIETLVKRIREGDLDLQPDFQRGEVWSEKKRRRLIDSILRRWHIPPIHVVEVPNKRALEVLDGKQRLMAIADFFADRLRIDGYAPPRDPEIEKLDGLRYSDISATEVGRNVRNFTMRQFTLSDYEPEEPAELFYRLNQPALLTAAEQRNAFIGPARNAIRNLVDLMESQGLNKSFIGFSNARMAYDDTLARLFILVERRSLLKKLTASQIAEWYRSDNPIDGRTVYMCEHAIKLLSEARPHVEGPIRLNKATLFSWLWFTIELIFWRPDYATSKDLGLFLWEFESLRGSSAAYEAFESRPYILFNVYDDRSSARVNDVSSVLLRDAVLWHTYTRLRRGVALPEYGQDLVALAESIVSKPHGLEAETAEFVAVHTAETAI